MLVYQPGGGTQRFVGTFETEQLAGRGYVVVSADHPGFSDTVWFPDGSRFQPDRSLRPEPTGDFRDDAMKNWDWLNEDVFPSWTADASYTLDQVEQLNRTPGQLFRGRLDLSRIGMFGWSFGGATSIEMSIDPRVKAVPVKKELVAMVNGWDQSLLDHSTNDWYTVTISALSCWPARQRPTSSTRAVPTPSEGHVSLVSGGYFPEENEAIGTGRTVTPAEPSRRNS